MDYIMTLDTGEALSLIEYAFKQREEELLFQRWIHGVHIHMGFEEFKASLKPKPVKNDKEILDEVKDILELFGGGRN